MCIKDHFDQPGYAVYQNLEEVLVLAAKGKAYTSQFKAVCEFYREDLYKAVISSAVKPGFFFY